MWWNVGFGGRLSLWMGSFKVEYSGKVGRGVVRGAVGRLYCGRMSLLVSYMGMPEEVWFRCRVWLVAMRGSRGSIASRR